jgi:hypothetical protein
MTRIAIEARGLQLAYQRKTILNQLNLAVPEGSVLGLVGQRCRQKHPDALPDWLGQAHTWELPHRRLPESGLGR